jgi:hypothetical protein
MNGEPRRYNTASRVPSYDDRRRVPCFLQHHLKTRLERWIVCTTERPATRKLDDERGKPLGGRCTSKRRVGTGINQSSRKKHEDSVSDFWGALGHEAPDTRGASHANHGITGRRLARLGRRTICDERPRNQHRGDRDANRDPDLSYALPQASKVCHSLLSKEGAVAA